MSDEATKTEEQPTLGKRVSKKPAFYTVPAVASSSKKSAAPTEGEGITLGDYPHFVEQLGKYKGDDDVLKALHTLIYNTPGKKLEVKKHLKLFSGFAKDAKIDEITEKVLDKKKLWTVSNLKSALGLFGLLQSGDREDLVNRLVEYLAKPEIVKGGAGGSKKKASAGKKRKSKSTKGGAKKKRSATGFILFGQANRESIKKKNPDASFGELSKLVGEAWKALKESEKKEWEDKAAELKAANESEAEEEEEEDEDDEEEEENEEEDGEEEVEKKESAADDDDDIFA